MTTRSASPCTVLTDGCHLVVDALKANDVATIYGVVGIPITDLARAAQASGIRYIGFRHEASAGNQPGLDPFDPLQQCRFGVARRGQQQSRANHFQQQTRRGRTAHLA